MHAPGLVLQLAMAEQNDVDLSQLLPTVTQDLFHPDSDRNLPDIDELFSQVQLPRDVDSYSPATKDAHAGVDELVSLPVPEVGQSAQELILMMQQLTTGNPCSKRLMLDLDSDSL